MKLKIHDTTFTNFLKFLGYKWNTLEENKIISNRTYYRIKNGEVKPQEKTLKKIADFLEIEVKTLKILLKNELESKNK
jgi:transcriptional regulator with XRE-family HTH domain